MKIVNVSQMQKAEQDCAQFNISTDMLMENAGKAAAEEIRNLYYDIQKLKIVVVVGPGNNGGDGLVAARYLHEWGAEVKVYLCGKRPDNDPNLVKIREAGINPLFVLSDTNYHHLNEWLLECNLIVDAIFGTGKLRPISREYAGILHLIHEARSKFPALRMIALDLPSGLNANTGEVDPVTPFVDQTITFAFPKTGLLNLPGAERAGKISVVDIGIPPSLVDYINTDMLTDRDMKSLLPRRPIVSNKGTFGKVLALVGSLNYIGAAYLSCSATLRVGAGLTTLAIGQNLHSVIASKLAEVTYLPLPILNQRIEPAESLELLKQNMPQYDIMLTGCGLGQSPSMSGLVRTLLLDSKISLPRLVLDADALNILAKVPEWWKQFKEDAVLTPHAGEMSRLTGKSIAEIQGNRIETAREAAVNWHKTVVLKGAYTVIASPEGKVRVTPFANAGLASAGTGDVLAGCIAGLAAQGLNLFDAATCGVYVHGRTAEMVTSEIGDAGMLAGDLLPSLPLCIRQLKEI